MHRLAILLCAANGDCLATGGGMNHLHLTPAIMAATGCLTVAGKRSSHWSQRIVIMCCMAFATAAYSQSMAIDHGQNPSDHGSGADEAAFLAENEVAMKKMMAAMSVQSTGDVDRDFVAMMIPHHQGAIDMSLALLRHGKNEKVRRLAQEIIITQQEEIAAMRLAVGENPANAAPSSIPPSPTTYRQQSPHDATTASSTHGSP
jgi:uncharacterized protein (DUF305 family)